MAQGIGSVSNQEIEAFVQGLRDFHSRLPASQQQMLEAVLDTARQAAAETSGYWVPDASTEQMAHDRMQSMLRDAEQYRLLHPEDRAEAGQGVVTTSGRPFEWLYGWLPFLHSPQQAQERGAAE